MKKHKKTEVVPPKFIQAMIETQKEIANRLNDVIQTMKHFAAIIMVLKKKGLVSDDDVQEAVNEVTGNKQDQHTENTEESSVRPEERSDDENHCRPEQSNILPSPYSRTDTDSPTP